MSSEMRAEVFRTHERPDYAMLARALLPKIREAYRDPEMEKKYQEWKRARDAGKERR